MLRFIGKVRSGKGKHSELVIPGTVDLNHAPMAWPDMFHPGSLNVGISKDGYPEGFMDPDEGGRGVTLLDDGVIEPAVVLAWDKIGNNGLRPKAGKPRRGTGQFWPAIITDAEVELAITSYEMELGIPATDALSRPPERLVEMVLAAFPELEEKMAAGAL